MKKENRVVIFGVLFLAAFLAEMYAFIQFRSEIPVIIGVAVFVLFTAYLFFDQVMDIFCNKRSEEKMQLEERLREIEKVQKAIYMVNRNSSQAIETSAQMQKELGEVINRAAKLIAKYNRQDIKNLATANGNYMSEMIATLEKSMGIMPNADVKSAGSTSYDSATIVDALNRNGEAVRFKVEGGFELVEADLSDIRDTLMDVHKVLMDLEEKVEKGYQYKDSYINKGEDGDNSSKSEADDFINVNLELAGAKEEVVDVAPIQQIENEQNELLNEMEQDQMQVSNEILEEQTEKEQVLQEEEEENIHLPDAEIIEEDSVNPVIEKVEETIDLPKISTYAEEVNFFDESVDNILDTLDYVETFEESDDLQSLIDADAEFDIQEMMDMDNMQAQENLQGQKEEDEIDIQTVLEQLRPKKPEPTPVLDIEDDYLVNTLDDGDVFKIVPDNGSKDLDEIEMDIPQEDFDGTLNPDEIDKLFASIGEE